MLKNFKIFIFVIGDFHVTLLILVGMLAAEAAFQELHKGSSMAIYWDNLKNSWIWEELYKARNYRPVSEAMSSLFVFKLSKYLFPWHCK